MKRKIIASIVLLIILLLPIIPTICTAEELEINTDDYRLDAVTDYEKTVKKANEVINVLRVVGMIVAVAGLIALGIKYMMGSAEERANYKKSMLPYLIGFILLFTITTIVTIINDLSTALNNAA